MRPCWHRTESIGHNVVFLVLEKEIQDDTVQYVIFGGFRAFHDMKPFDIPIWLHIPYGDAKGRRMARRPKCIEQYVDIELWTNHLKYEELFMQDK